MLLERPDNSNKSQIRNLSRLCTFFFTQKFNKCLRGNEEKKILGQLALLISLLVTYFAVLLLNYFILPFEKDCIIIDSFYILKK